jgi:hypothetical protein
MARSEIRCHRRRRVLNAHHIGNDFTSLLYIAVTSSEVERVEFDLSHPPPPPQFSSPIMFGRGEVWGQEDGLPRPPPQAGRVTVSHRGGRVRVG